MSEEARLEERAPARGWARRALYGGGGPAGAVLRGATWPLARGWQAIAERRLTARGPVRRLPAPAIAVGNVTVGGGGKTSLVEWLLAEGLAPEMTVAVLTRGYGREMGGVWVLPPGPTSRELAIAAGDEPALLARRGAWVGVGADRTRAARALAEHVRPDVFLLDDALQHRRVARALDLVVFAASDLDAPARCVPAGPLRQGASWLPLLGGWVVTGVDPRTRDWPVGTIGAAFAAWWTRLPGTVADWEHEIPVTLAGWQRGDEEAFDPAGREVVAFAGVARPETIHRSVERTGLAPVVVAVFPDHRAYGPRDIALLLADHPGAAFVTTEKDAIKLDPRWFGPQPVGVLRRRLVPRDPEVLRRLVREAIAVSPA